MRFPIWSTLALLPVTVLLAVHGSFLALSYCASMLITFAYHASNEQQWRRVDHVFAYGVIGSNAWMTFETHSFAWTAVALAMVVISLRFYHLAKTRHDLYDWWHGWWHLAAGAAGWCFACGYLA